MSVPDPSIRMTIEEYLANEEIASVRHEFVDGQVFAMTGTSLRHNLISTNLLRLLSNHLDGSGRRAFISDIKVRVEATNCFYYPDILVSCTPKDLDSVVVETPVLIFEILSPSTATVDRREKLIAYRYLESLREYVIVYQTRRRVQIHRKTEEPSWQSTDVIEDNQALILHSVALSDSPLIMPIASIYKDLDWGGQESKQWQVREEEGQYTW